jgi:peptide/nickel transport system permease protein
MTRYLISRLLQALASLIAMSMLIFVLSRLTGDPAVVLMPDIASPADRQAFRVEMGYDKPSYMQYLVWVWKVMHGDLGMSLAHHLSVAEILSQRISASLELAAAGFAFSLAIGIPIGIYAAAYHNSKFDLVARLFAIFGQAIPGFWLGLILIMIFGVWLQILPAGGRTDVTSVILPAITIGWVTAAGTMRLTRSSMLEVLNTDYVKLARIKGVSETAILWKHALKNAAPVIMTYAGLILFLLLTGTIVTETVFAWPGVGSLMLDAVMQRDFPVVQGAVLFITAIYLLGNLGIDVCYALLNPRVRYS